MEPISFHRKLTATLSADVAGYSRLMQDDEADTVTLKGSSLHFLQMFHTGMTLFGFTLEAGTQSHPQATAAPQKRVLIPALRGL